jgi:hypothetical protein
MFYVRPLIPALFLLVGSAFAADPATVQDLRVGPSGSGVKVEIVLSTAQTPNVLTAVNPDRIVVELPDTISDARQRHITVNQSGVLGVRMGLNSANPPITRVIVDLEHMQQYSIATDGTKIVLTIGSSVAAKERPPVRANPPAAAASAPVASIFRRKPDATIVDTSTSTQPPPLVPSPGNAPAWEPPRRQRVITDEVPAIQRPSAKSPKIGSLQEGTVFPGAGVDSNASSGPAPKTVSDIPEVAVAGHTGDSSLPSAGQAAQPTNAIPEVATTRQLAAQESAADTTQTASTGAQQTTSEPLKSTPKPVELASATPPSQPPVTKPAVAEVPQLSASEIRAQLRSAEPPVAIARLDLPGIAPPPPAKPAVPQLSASEIRTGLGTATTTATVSQPELPSVAPPQPKPKAEVPQLSASEVRSQLRNTRAPAVTSAPDLPSVAPPSEAKPAVTEVAELSVSEVRAQLGTVSSPAPGSPFDLPSVAAPPEQKPSDVLEESSTNERGEQFQDRVAMLAMVAPLPVVTSPDAKRSEDVDPHVAPMPVEVQTAQQETALPVTSEQNVPQDAPAVTSALAAQQEARPAASEQTTPPTPVPGTDTKPEPVIMANAAAPAPELAAPAAPINPLIEQATRTPSDLTTSYKIKFVTPGAVYLEGGRNAGLAEGMKLIVRDDTIKAPENLTDPDPRIIAELEVASVAETSAVTEIKSAKRDLTVNDLAWLSQADQDSLVVQRTLSSTRKYPIVVSFTEGDPMDEEVRASVPRPPLPSVNRVRGRIGLDYSTTMGKGFSSNQLGLVLRSDITRIGGTYWNLSGYWRGRLNSSSSGGQQTLQDLINRTYQMNMTYDNPNSRWVMGFGRMYLPWATSLDTLDGGYLGSRVKKGAIIGLFGGSTPDPTSWNYTPGRNIAGAFANFTGGSYDAFRYFSTVGGAASTINGQFDRPFVFFENNLSYKRLLSFSSSVQADKPPGNQAVASPGVGLARAFLTARFQPRERISFDANYNYLRDIPTFDSALVGTGLLDKYLFQGFSGGARVEVVRNIWVYTNLGSSSRTGDTKNSLNQMYGVTFTNIWHTGLSADTHYSKFDSAFGGGSYESLALSRNLTEGAHIEVMLGRQLFSSTTTTNGVTTTSANNSKFINSLFDINFGAHYFLQGGFTTNRGNLQNYNQMNFGIGYRFDNRTKRKHQ